MKQASVLFPAILELPVRKSRKTPPKYQELSCEWAPNEKVAAEAAIGASFAGARSFCAMKHVGLNVAADPFYTMSYIGVNGGMVLGVADDPGMHSSQNEQDSRRHAIGAKVPCWSRRILRNARTLPSWLCPFRGV